VFEETKRFHELTKVHEPPKLSTGAAPITHVQVFYKEYPRFETVELPEPSAAAMSLDEAWQRRSSTRAYSSLPLALEDVSAVLGSCRILDAEREPPRRSYPSAGARCPIELYLLSFRVEGLEQGCSHYKMRTHELEKLWPAELAGRTDEIVSPYVADPAAAIVMTSVISRSEVKYGHKAYPFSLIEAGHMAQNIQLACAAHSLGCCSVGGFVDDAISSLLDLTEDEIPLYVLALGKTGSD